MKILDILSEAIDDGTSDINNDSLTQLVRTARDRWLNALNNKGANPANEQAYVQEFIATQQKYRPELNTMNDGLYRRAAQKRYANTYHTGDDAWNFAEDKHTRLSGNVHDASDTTLDAARLGGADGNLGDRAAFQSAQGKKQKGMGADPIQKQAQTIARGQRPRSEINPTQTTPRLGQQQFYSSDSIDGDEHAERDARLAADDEALTAAEQERIANGGLDRVARAKAESGMTTKQKRQNRFAQISNRAKK